ncbi:MAG: AAA family ATPase [Chloroflexi bacterium]|nr:AAA family ATPase [Chloroflexota bacterium]
MPPAPACFAPWGETITFTSRCRCTWASSRRRITNHTLSSKHSANGGYLVVRARDLFLEPFTWDGLKRSLVAERIKTEDLSARGGETASIPKGRSISRSLRR